jgi:hypothetical protein
LYTGSDNIVSPVMILDIALMYTLLSYGITNDITVTEHYGLQEFKNTNKWKKKCILHDKTKFDILYHTMYN